MLKTDSLKNSLQFNRVYKKGRSRADSNLVMYVLDNGSGENRLGISISKKQGNSVVRHRFCRLVREAYRLNENVFNSGLDIVVVARKGAGRLGFFEVERSMMYLAKLHHILV